MSAQRVPPRPRQVTVAGAMAIGASLLLVVSLFDAMAGLRSVETRRAVAEFLARPPGSGLGLTPADVTELLHALVLVDGALAAVAGVMGVYVLQRNAVARVVLSAAAFLLLLTAPLSGGVMAFVLAVAASMTWSQPARDWFAGRAPSPVLAEPRTAPPGPPAAPPRSMETDPARSSAPSDLPPPRVAERDGPRDTGADAPGPAPYPFGEPRPATAAAGGASAWPPPAVTRPTRPTRPGQVTAAAVLTWVFAGGVALGCLVVVLMLLLAQDALVDALLADPRSDRLDLSVPDLLSVLWVMCAVLIFWGVAASALAVLALRRNNLARWLLVASAAMSLWLSVPVTAGSGVGVVFVVAALATVVLLTGRPARQWYAASADRSWPGRPSGSATGPWPPPGPPPSDKPPVW